MSTQTLPRSPARNHAELYWRAYWRVYAFAGLWATGVAFILR